MHVIGGFLITLGVSVLIGAWLSKRGASSQSLWPTTTGTVTRSEVSSSGEFYEPVVEYTYEHNGRAWRATTIRSHLISSSTRGRSERIVNRYPVSSSVKVHFDPNNPMDAVLEPGGDSWMLPFWFLIAGFLLFIGITLVLEK
jgi:hypothetical protein